jgi:hypothetical protein
MNYIYDRSSNGKILSGSTQSEENMTIDEYAAYTSNTIKRSIESLSGKEIDMNMNIRNLAVR